MFLAPFIHLVITRHWWLFFYFFPTYFGFQIGISCFQKFYNCKVLLLIVIESSWSILTFLFEIQIIILILVKSSSTKWARKTLLDYLLFKSILLLRVLASFLNLFGMLDFWQVTILFMEAKMTLKSIRAQNMVHLVCHYSLKKLMAMWIVIS